MTDNRMRNIMIFRCGVCDKETTQTGSKTKCVEGMRVQVCGKCADGMSASGQIDEQKPAGVLKAGRVRSSRNVRNSRNSEHMADVTALVIKKPRTMQELLNVTNYDENAIRRYLQALCGEGLVTVAGGRNNINTWTWQ